MSKTVSATAASVVYDNAALSAIIGDTVPTKRKRMNLEIIQGNLSEAVEELRRLQRKAARKDLTEEEFQVGLLHAYHHLNFAWNIRHQTTEQYVSQETVQGMGQVSQGD